MIDTIRLRNFKCFESLDLELKPLTLLTGFNAAGKSTAIQTLLLLAQTLRRAVHGRSTLTLNGSLVALGSPADVINGGGTQMELGIASGDLALGWRFAVSETNRRVLNTTAANWANSEQAREFAPRELDGLRPVGLDQAVSALLARVHDLIFLSAARQVDTEVYPVPVDMNIARGDVGHIGQFASWWLHEEGDSEVDAQRCCERRGQASTLRQQVNAWLSDLFPGAEVNVVPFPKTGLMRLELRSGRTNDWSRPANIGYGISYAFPILLAGLGAQADRTFILDSPEAHLHPRGQSRIGSFLAQMASAGVQTIVETHSDHLLNGVRRALRDRIIEPTDVAIYFFTARPEAQVIKLSVDKDGNISEWPEGFFDQSEKDLASLAGWE